MSAAKWRVEKCRETGCPEWHVYDPDGEFHGPSGWHEALAYADRQARTVELVIPRIDTEHFIFTPPHGYIIVEKGSGDSVRLSQEEDQIWVPQDRARRLALILFALAWRKEQQ